MPVLTLTAARLNEKADRHETLRVEIQAQRKTVDPALQVTNGRRAGWAKKALDAYKASRRCDEDDRAHIQDLIGDLLHLARRDHGIEGDDLLALTRRAFDMNFAEAIEDPENEDDFEVCRTCGEHYAAGGDGYDGECPGCADKTDQKLHPENYED
ncbi:hypothetical protein [Shinella zoogloeoides]|uniref:hypothetical protein n=1 Tax=Shinella zoogloeoides TaxID=352475 RepID=UPI00273EE34E|nr:hypothetical protein [Shinella zoogloeoides]WLR90914.1 hypothetical protein Q9316_00625 [Shinella zoogloeoides]